MKIIKYPAKILSQRAKKVKNPLDPDIQKLIKRMIETMRKAQGRGLAAPQIGKSLRLCVVEEIAEPGSAEVKPHILINPQITSHSKTKSKMEEGCLSLPGKFYQIERPETIKVRYLDESGKKAKTKASGILARSIQHEIDHLEGILIINLVKK